jgi:hypothetical protein
MFVVEPLRQPQMPFALALTYLQIHLHTQLGVILEVVEPQKLKLNIPKIT